MVTAFERKLRENPISSGGVVAIVLGLVAVGGVVYLATRNSAPPGGSMPRYNAGTATPAAITSTTLTVPVGASIRVLPSGNAVWVTPGPTTDDASVVADASTQGGFGAFIAIAKGTARLTGADNNNNHLNLVVTVV